MDSTMNEVYWDDDQQKPPM